MTASEFRALLAAATPGEWKTVDGPPNAIPASSWLTCGNTTVYASTTRVSNNGVNGAIVLATCDREDARLIAAMRNAAPVLVECLEAVERLGAARERVRCARMVRDGETDDVWIDAKREDEEALRALCFAADRLHAARKGE